MITDVNLDMFVKAFLDVRPDSFSTEALRIIFDHIEEIEADTGIETRLDIVDIDCRYIETAETAQSEEAAIIGEFENENGETRFVYMLTF